MFSLAGFVIKMCLFFAFYEGNGLLCGFDEGSGLFWSFHEENGIDEENLFLGVWIIK